MGGPSLFVLCGIFGAYPALVDPGPICPDGLPRPGLIRCTYNRSTSEQNTGNRQRIPGNQKRSAIKGPYAARYTATTGVFRRESQIMSDLQKSCILGHARRILTIYRKIDYLHSRRLRKRIVLRSLSSCYPQTINNSLYYYTVFVQDLALYLHCA